MSASEHDEFASARAVLRMQQAPMFALAQVPDVTAEALERHQAITEYTIDPATGRGRRGAFTYEPAKEDKRIHLGEEIIRRIQPGPFEDPGYFALLAHQAASLEMAREHFFGPWKPKPLFGTTGHPQINAWSSPVDGYGHSVVVVNSGLVDLVYQCAKAVIHALDPVESEPGTGGLVTVHSDREAAAQRIASDPWPSNRLYETLEAYFYKGYPRASAYESVPAVQHPPLAVLVNLGERFVIGHEYGHGFLPPDHQPAPGDPNPSHSEEFFCDTNSLVLSVLSAAAFDDMAPGFALASAIFALKCLDLERRAASLVRTGSETALPAESKSHPAPKARAQVLVAALRQYFVQTDDGLKFGLQPQPPAAAESWFTEADVRQAYLFADVLEEVWNRTRGRLAADRDKGRPLHQLWAS